MNKNDYYEELNIALEKCNRECISLLNSPEYRLGTQVIKLEQMVRKLDIKGFVQLVKNLKVRKKVNKEFIDITSTADLAASYYGQSSIADIQGKKVVVYTCVIGNYDNIASPYVITPNVDYIIFSDNDVQVPGWRTVKVSLPYKGIDNPTLVNRYIKMHPLEVLPEYDYVMYVDGKVHIISDISSLFDACINKTGIAMHRHVSRNNIYNEIKACIVYGKGNPEKLNEQATKYQQEGFPDDYGLLEATIIVYDIKNHNQYMICNSWWDEFTRSESFRDQISLPYVLWKLGYKITDVGNLGMNLYKNPKFRIATTHK